MKLAVMGLGGRGSCYAHFTRYYGSEVAAVCDPDPSKRSLAAEYGVGPEAFYEDEEAFFAAGKIADALVIATTDTLHYRQAMRALELGYDLLLEKPIACSIDEVRRIRDKAIKLGRKVCVCHVLRYSPVYEKIKEILDSKMLGEVVSMQLTEGIGYYHFDHSYVRGNWRNTTVSAPLILAKNCHDLDIVCWLLGTKCKSVSSIGQLTLYKEENAPKGSAAHCVDCKYKDTCPHSGFLIYNNATYEALAGLAKHGRLGQTKAEIEGSLSDRTNPYSRCVFRCDNNVVDHQLVNMQFENDVTVSLCSTALTEEMFRSIDIYCTKGHLRGKEWHIEYELFGGETTGFDIVLPEGGYANHAGGDVRIVKQFIDYVEKDVRTVNITDIATSVLSHEIGFLAEESRLQGGVMIALEA